MGVFSIATRADVRGRGSLATCRERWEHFPTKQLYSAVSKKPQLTLRMSKKTQNYANGSKTTILTHIAPEMTPMRYPQQGWALWKNNPPEQRKRAPSGPYGGGPYKELGMQHKAKLAPRPPSGPLRYQLCHMGPFLAGELLAGVNSVSRAHQWKGRPDTFGVLQQSCYVIMW